MTTIPIIIPAELFDAGCAYCIDGRLPVTDPVLGPGYAACGNCPPPCPACADCPGAFYALDAATHLGEWSRRLNLDHHFVPVLCISCGALVDAVPLRKRGRR